jgi:transcription-repair coupling factor (superfamily II helicase)
MYMKLLEETVRELKGEEIEDDVRATVNLGIDLKIDEGYIPDMNQRLMVYRKVAATRTENELEAPSTKSRTDTGRRPTRFSIWPSTAASASWRIVSASRQSTGRPLVVIRFRPQAKVDPVRLVKVVHDWPGATLVPRRR